MAWKVIWSDEAIADLQAIMVYIASDNPAAAESLGRAIIERTRLLADLPLAGRVVPEERNPEIRELIVAPYRVIFEIQPEPGRVDILRIWHAARGVPEL